MRLIKEIPLRDMKITLFSWNNRYLIKLEQGLLEQTYKIDQFDILHEDDLLKLIDADFIQQAQKRFLEMSISLQEAKVRLG
jgi:hypothetical protein